MVIKVCTFIRDLRAKIYIYDINEAKKSKDRLHFCHSIKIIALFQGLRFLRAIFLTSAPGKTFDKHLMSSLIPRIKSTFG